MKLVELLAVVVLRAYKLGLSPLLHTLAGPLCGCRHTPTCSSYAEEALRRHGLLRGGRLALSRLARCHPWGSAGYDPVPPVVSPQR